MAGSASASSMERYADSERYLKRIDKVFAEAELIGFELMKEGARRDESRARWAVSPLEDAFPGRADLVAGLWEAGDPAPVHAPAREEALSAGLWIKRAIFRTLVSAIIVGYALNEGAYGKKWRNADCRYWLIKALARNDVIWDVEVGRLELRLDRVVKLCRELPASALERRLRELSVGVPGGPSIRLAEDARINDLLRLLDPGNDVELRSVSTGKQGFAGLVFIYGRVVERCPRYTVIDELAVSCNVLSNSLVSGAEFLKGRYEGEIVIRERCLRQVIRSVYIEGAQASGMNAPLLELLEGAKERLGSKAYSDMLYRIELRSVASYRKREAVIFESGIRDSNLESALSDRQGEGPLMALNDLSTAATELLALLEVLSRCESERAEPLERTASIICEIRDSYHLEAGRPWLFPVKSLSVSLLAFKLRAEDGWLRYSDELREAIWTAIGIIEEEYESAYVETLRFLNSRTYREGGAPMPLSALVGLRARGGPDDGSAWSVTGSYNMYQELIDGLDGKGRAELECLAKRSCGRTIRRLARAVGVELEDQAGEGEAMRAQAALRARLAELGEGMAGARRSIPRRGPGARAAQ